MAITSISSYVTDLSQTHMNLDTGRQCSTDSLDSLGIFLAFYTICCSIRNSLPADIFIIFPIFSTLAYSMYATTAASLPGNTYLSYLDKLTVLNNKLLRILQKKGHACCKESLYLNYNTLPPVQLFNYQVLNLVHKTVFSPYLLPSIF